jgi:predicted patatin/cPLA2 family phospholipase
MISKQNQISNKSSVIRLLHERRNGQEDQHKLALIIGGGGMRGCISAAMLSCLYEAGMSKLFDAVYAVSSGVPNSCHFLTGQPQKAISLYQRLAEKERFISRKRFLRGGLLIDGEFLMQQLLEGPTSILWEELSEIEIPLTLVTTAYETGETKFWRNPRDITRLRLLVEASGQVPTITGQAVEIDKRSYCDGAISCPLPIQLALSECTHILCLVNTPKGQNHAGLVERKTSSWYLQRRVPHLAYRYSEHQAIYKSSIDLLSSHAASTAVIYPEELLPQLTTDPKEVEEAIVDGYRSMSQALSRG